MVVGGSGDHAAVEVIMVVVAFIMIIHAVNWPCSLTKTVYVYVFIYLLPSGFMCKNTLLFVLCFFSNV